MTPASDFAKEANCAINVLSWNAQHIGVERANAILEWASARPAALRKGNGYLLIMQQETLHLTEQNFQHKL